MPQAANMVIADGTQPTAVNHTFVPLGPDPKDTTIFWFEDQSQATPIGYWKLSIQMLRPGAAKSGESSQNRTVRIKLGVHQPILETVSNSTVSGIVPAPTLAYVPRAFLEFVIPERASVADRRNLRMMTLNLLGHTSIDAVVNNLQMVY